MNVSELMDSRPFAVAPELTLQRAVDLLRELALRHLPVVDHDRLVGIVSERDLLEATGWEPERFFDQVEHRERIVRDVMSVAVETVAPDEDPARACARLLERGIGCLPVVQGARLVGMLEDVDFLRAYLRFCRQDLVPPLLDPAVTEVMSRELLTAETTTELGAALEGCVARGVRHLPVLHEGWFVGMVSDRDLRLRSLRARLDRLTVGDVMTTDIVSVAPADRASDVAAVLLGRGLGSAVVLEEGKLLGLVSSTDVLRLCVALDWHGVVEARPPGAAGSGRSPRATDRLRVAHVMTPRVHTCRAGDSLARAAQVLWDRDCGIVPIVDGGRRVVGVLTDRDACMAALFEGRPLGSIAVDGVMARDVRSCSPDDGLARALALLADARLRRLPVLDWTGRLVGLVSLADLAREADRELAAGRPALAERVAEVLKAVSMPRASALPEALAPEARRPGAARREGSPA